jgi:hypothetical protein
MKTKTIAACVVALCASFDTIEAVAQQRAASPATLDGTMLVQIIGEVQAVDASAHRVTVVDTQGHATQLNVGPDMQDLDKLPLGTRVKGAALQPVTLTKAANAKPQAMIPGDNQFVAKVDHVDDTTGVILLKDANDLPIEVRARDPHKAAALSNGIAVKVVVRNKSGRGTSNGQ